MYNRCIKMKLIKEQQKRVDRLSRMTPREWDAVCKRCGICCLSKLLLKCVDVDTHKCDDRTVYLHRCCNNFDPKTRKCQIYEKRLSADNCEKVDIELILAGDLLPASCGYVEYVFGPAAVPASVDFNTVRPIEDEKLEVMPWDRVQREIIPDSLFWNREK